MERQTDFTKDFERVGQWIEQFFAHPERYDVLPQVKPGDIAALLPGAAPEQGEPFDRLLADFEQIIVPGITQWNHPRFFAYFATSSAPVAILAEALAATLDVKVMLWRTSPAAAELETVVLQWLGAAMGLPPSWTGIIYDTASIAGFTALAAAREALALGIREHGLSGRDLPRLRVYITEHTHSHVEKAAIALGVGTQNVVRVACDESFAMRPDALEAAMAQDVADGYRPMAVVATVGTTSTTSVDPVRALAPIVRKYNAWYHVDAAYAGVAAIMPEYRFLVDGVELADSFVANPHKWLFVPMDLSVLYVRDEAVVRNAFSLVPEYLTTTDQDVRNYMDYGLQLGRRFRALKLWFVMRYFGLDGLRVLLREHVGLARTFAAWVREAPDWEVMAPHPLSVVCFRYHPAGEADQTVLERLNASILERVNATGEMFISHTKIGGQYVLRLAIGNLRTTIDDVRAAWELLQEHAPVAAGS